MWTDTIMWSENRPLRAWIVLVGSWTLLGGSVTIGVTALANAGVVSPADLAGVSPSEWRPWPMLGWRPWPLLGGVPS